MYKKIFPQVVGELMMVPWGHHRIIIDKCKTIEKCLFYINPTIILPDAIKRKVYYVRILFTSETKRNYDYGSWSEFIEAEEIK